ncbi:MAG: inositol monophosphatase family protein, partial [Candidatus Dormibacteraceae bacterium]
MLEIALEAARTGANLLRQVQLYKQTAQTKQPADYVTEFDYRSEAAIIDVLERRSPGIPILGEERGGKLSQTMWTVDPLDGTTNFIHGLPLVAVSVALINDGYPELGVVIAPWLNLEFTAQHGKGVSRNGELLPSLSKVDPQKALIATGFPMGNKKRRLPQYEEVLNGALRRFEDLRRGGSSALDLCWT